MLILVVVLVHMLETFHCKTFLLRDVRNLDFCFLVPILIFLLKTMGFLRFLLRDRQFLIMQHLLPPVVSSTLIALSFLLNKGVSSKETVVLRRWESIAGNLVKT